MGVVDVTRAARSLQDSVHQKLTPAARLASAIEMSDFTRTLTEAGTRARHPAASDVEVRRLVIATLYGGRSGRR